MNENLPAWARDASRIAVLTGAGISTDSGMPDYRGPEGIWGTAVEHGATLVIVNRDPTPYDELATEVVRDPIGVAIPRICDALVRAAG